MMSLYMVPVTYERADEIDYTTQVIVGQPLAAVTIHCDFFKITKGMTTTTFLVRIFQHQPTWLNYIETHPQFKKILLDLLQGSESNITPNGVAVFSAINFLENVTLQLSLDLTLFLSFYHQVNRDRGYIIYSSSQDETFKLRIADTNHFSQNTFLFAGSFNYQLFEKLLASVYQYYNLQGGNTSQSIRIVSRVEGLLNSQIGLLDLKDRYILLYTAFETLFKKNYKSTEFIPAISRMTALLDDTSIEGLFTKSPNFRAIRNKLVHGDPSYNPDGDEIRSVYLKLWSLIKQSFIQLIHTNDIFSKIYLSDMYYDDLEQELVSLKQ